jgi:hypothetical protein
VANSGQKTESKQNTLEASNLRAFIKYYIISNQQHINLNGELMYSLALGITFPLGRWGSKPRAAAAPGVTPLPGMPVRAGK